MIYFNYAGLSPERIEVHEHTARMRNKFQETLFSETGVQWYLKELVHGRAAVNKLLNVETDLKNENVLFVPNATSAYQLLLSEVLLREGEIILISDQEHPSIFRSIERLRKKGIDYKVIEAKSENSFCDGLEEFSDLYNARMLTISHVAYTDGRIFPLRRICKIAKKKNLIVAVDGAQAVGHIPVNLADLDLDFYFFSGHKWCSGPMGTGALVISERYKSSDVYIKLGLLNIGSIQKYFHLGTQNIALISGFAKACEIKSTEMESVTDHLVNLRQQFLSHISGSPYLKPIHWDGEHSPGIAALSILPWRISPLQLTSYLEENGVAVKPFVAPENTETIRISWSHETTEADIKFLIEKLHRAFHDLRNNGLREP